MKLTLLTLNQITFLALMIFYSKADNIPDNEGLELSYRSENEFFNNEQDFEKIVNKVCFL